MQNSADSPVDPVPDADPKAAADAAYLKTVGDRVRDLRAQRGMTRRALAQYSGVSERYLAQLESGLGNPTITVVRSLARAFDVAPDTLVVEGHLSSLAQSIIGAVRELAPEQLAVLQRQLHTSLAKGAPAARNARIALIGLRGAGKSTLGRLLAARRGVPFIELDSEIERDAGVPLAEIFEFYGQSGFRRLELTSFERILGAQREFVLAAGGSIVADPWTFERVLATCFTVWLTASPAEHMGRVIAQGDMRPMHGNPAAMHDLHRILAGREALYRRADCEITTSARTIDETLAALAGAVPLSAVEA